MKKYRFSLTLRIFLTTSALLIAACAITYGTIAYLTPITYTSILEEELNRQSDALVAALEKEKPVSSEVLLEDFVWNTGAELTLVDDYGNTLYDSTPQDIAAAEAVQSTVVEDSASTVESVFGYASSENTAAVDASTTEESAVIVQDTAVEMAEASSATGHMYSFTFVDGTRGLLTISGGLRAVNQAVEALGNVLPFLVSVILLISLAGSYFYARFITRPIVSISKIARCMASLDFDARWTRTRTDEIGELGSSLNLLSDNLSGALRQLEDANQKLQQDIDRERELERQRMAFFSAASHELKTPITILKGQLSGMLAQVGIYQDREKYLARALVITGRMEGLVKEILTINRLGAGAFSLQKEAVELSALLEGQLALDGELMEQKELRLKMRLESGMVVQGDAALLAKALGNVLMNAILYSPPGASITIEGEDGAIRVENTGVSIPEESLAQLFTPFYRVEQSRNRKTGGSGLGLYLVKSILDLHGATCRMENTEQGVRFTAVFLLAEPDVNTSSTAEAGF